MTSTLFLSKLLSQKYILLAISIAGVTMFFCDKCAYEMGWQDYINPFMLSYGPCEICYKPNNCNDVPSKYLPRPKKAAPKLDIDSIT